MSQNVIVALPDAKESSVVAGWITEQGYTAVKKSAAGAAAEELARPFTLLITDADLAFRDGLHQIAQRHNPSTPTLVVGGAEAERQCETAGVSTIHVPRPIEQPTLLVLMSMAILDGRPVRRSERKKVQRLAAMVNGAPAYILDCSYEGVRLELPADRRTPLPPTFNLRVPLIGVSVTIKRVWSRSIATSQGRSASSQCGGSLNGNARAAEIGWRKFVDTVESVSSPIATVLETS